ncbi:DUF3857 domain-containing protein [uncultured Duncaniella sp.]|uniref:DUF3857 domain-containing protein n=1 Tax=uncultured Duncaniella sp. TaxID=2768039 RepID=UPI002597F71C|nr:DUF3857 domain-containing protein [uncultured Duncaniella sp.]
MKKVILTTVALISALLSYADSKEDYRRFTDTIRAEVYAMELPAFNVKEIPDKYRNESAVIKAIYEDVDAKKKTGFGRMSGTLRFSRKAQVQGSHLTRMLIHVNDKAALEKYSEFDFSTDKKTRNWDGYAKNRRAMGVRLIKPDGRTVDIDTSEFIEVEEGKKGEKKSRKLAIPGLETGDDIDVFFYTESKLQNVHPDPMVFTLRDEAPIMNYRIHCVVDDNLTTQYRTLNGAPDFTVSRDEDKNYVLDLEMTDIPKEPRLWYNSDQQSPTVKIHIFNRRNSDDFTPRSARKDGLHANPDATLIQEDVWDARSWWMQPGSVSGSMPQEYIRDGKKIGKTLQKLMKDGKITAQQAADYTYNILCYIYIAKRGALNNLSFSKQFNYDLCSFKIPQDPGISTRDSYEPLDQLINLNHTLVFARVSGDQPRYYFPPVGGILAPSDLPPSLQGRKVLMWRKYKERKKKPTTDADYITLPMTSAADNRNVTSVEATIDGTSLSIRREEAYTGATKSGGFRVLSEEDINEGYKAWLNRYGLTVDIKENKKEAADRQERYADGRNEQKNDFKAEIKAYHGTDASEFSSGSVTSIGIDPSDPELRYNISYTMDNLVKRAGKNLILSAGKLMSGQIEALPSDRWRTDDVYLRTPREYVTRISLKLPAGYSVNARSLAALDTSVSNETGSFTVSASAPSADLVSIEITKRYNAHLLSASDWSELLKVLDAANAWQGSTLILDKK